MPGDDELPAEVPDISPFEPETDLQLDLTKLEKLRATALTLAIRYYVETIVKDGELYRAMVKTGAQLKPAAVGGVIECAIGFEHFLRTGQALAPQDAELVEELAELTKG